MPHNHILKLNRQSVMTQSLLHGIHPLVTPILSLRGHISRGDDAASRVNKEECQNLAVAGLRRVREREWRDAVLERIGECQKPALAA